MMTSRLSETLQQGLLIENRNMMLPWGASKTALIQHGRPDQVIQVASVSNLLWTGPVVLSGLSGITLEAQIGHGLPLTQVWVWLEKGYSDRSAEAEFRRAYHHLQRLFGSPVPRIPEIDDGELEYDKFTCWERNGFDISLMLKLGPEFGDYSYGCLVIVGKNDLKDSKWASGTMPE